MTILMQLSGQIHSYGMLFLSCRNLQNDASPILGGANFIGDIFEPEIENGTRNGHSSQFANWKITVFKRYPLLN